MFAFIHKEKPRSGYSRKKDDYKERIKTSAKIEGDFQLIEDSLYARIYYFHPERYPIDVDNLSKPILDALKGVLYKDDSQINTILVKKINIQRKVDIEFENLENVKIEVAEELSSLLDKKEHFIYVEFGVSANKTIRFGELS